MSKLRNCGICCSLISIWGILQLFVMGLSYFLEAVVLIEDCAAEEYDDYEDFIAKTKSNYKTVAINCWICTALYAITLGLSYTCIIKARRKEKLEALMMESDEYACAPPIPKKIKVKNIK